MPKIGDMQSRHFPTPLIWIFRILVGGVFIISGLAKNLDPWGFIYKIEDYLSVWGWDIPRTIVLAGALCLSTFEFVSGCMLAVGCYRRIVPRLMLALMGAFMLPLTLYILIKDPVDDCGCFGDFIVLSNFWTFAKNVVITGMLIPLVIYNNRINGLYHSALQWIIGVVTTLYIGAVGLLSYLVQPMIDFRPYPEGSSIVAEEQNDYITFVYEKDGIEYEFGIDDLPDDETYSFVGRKGSEESGARLTIFDPATEEDVTEEVLTDDGRQLLLIMSEPARADLSDTYVINELYDYLQEHDCEMIALIAAGPEKIAEWQNLSMAEYPCYMADDTQLKELVRGIMSMIFVEDGIIKWKRTISSIDLKKVEKVTSGKSDINELRFNGKGIFASLSVGLLSLLGMIWVLQIISLIILRRKATHPGSDKQ
ncbi:MAG: DoxX family protein [Muribaculaceae bacterium]|nr:DoxX family protein [Muribaculaceae bacterium]